jgi:predicted Rossmann fold nucleotide-binding protein DprA/Smf involved in DNA uptake
MDKLMQTRNFTDDAKTILLLCGRFGKNDATRPLSLGEYNRLTDWMLDKRIRPADLLAIEASQLLETLPHDIDAERFKRLLARGAAMALAIDKWTSSGIWVICRSDADYPARLKQHLKKQAPAILYGIGPAGLLNRGGLAVVGSRNVDSQGEQFTRQAVTACSQQGIPIVSGGARGVDQVAMLEGLHAGGTVVGALADSLLKSAVAKKYRDGIREQHLVLVSAFSPEARFNVGNAMGRNKHIYALADFCLVISAETGKGGTWAGATEELKRPGARPVFVRDEPTAPEGNRALIKIGAQPYPEPPWGDDLAARLSEKSNTKTFSTGEQLSIFPQIPLSSPAAVSVKEQAAGYTEDQTGTMEEMSEEAVSKRDVPASVFDAVRPVLLNALGDWEKPKELAEKLEVRKPQLDDWLKRAVDEGWIEKKNRPVQYRRLK